MYRNIIIMSNNKIKIQWRKNSTITSQHAPYKSGYLCTTMECIIQILLKYFIVQIES